MRWLLPFVGIIAACSGDAARSLPPQPRDSASADAASSASGPSDSAASASSVASASPRVARAGSASAAETARAASVGAVSVPAPTAPPGLDGGRHPFVLFLHGLGGSGESFVHALGVAEVAAEKHFVYAAPDGAVGPNGRFWNASSACCDFERSGVDHVAALGAVIAAARGSPRVDPARIYVIGFSNGGFMAHRLACSVPGVAAIVSVAGSAPNEGDPPCNPAAPVAVLEIHGDKDSAVSFEGGHVLRKNELPTHLSALASVGLWSKVDGCARGPEERGRMDLVASLPGEETIDLRFSGCKAPVALWRVTGGDHFIAATPGALAAMWSFLEAQRGGVAN